VICSQCNCDYACWITLISIMPCCYHNASCDEAHAHIFGCFILILALHMHKLSRPNSSIQSVKIFLYVNRLNRQNGSVPNFQSHCICVAQRWVALASGCTFLEFDESCTMHVLDVECGPSSFHIPELLSNGTVLPKTGMLAFYCMVSVDTTRCR